MGTARVTGGADRGRDDGRKKGTGVSPSEEPGAEASLPPFAVRTATQPHYDRQRGTSMGRPGVDYEYDETLSPDTVRKMGEILLGVLGRLWNARGCSQGYQRKMVLTQSGQT